MAIAYDNSSKKAFTAGSSVSFSHVLTGSNAILFVGIWDTAGTTHNVTGVTWNTSENLTSIQTQTFATSAVSSTSLWYLVNPTATTANVVISTTTGGSTAAVASSYTGAAQSGQPDSSAKNSYNSTSHTTWSLSTTVVAANSWVVAAMVNDSNAPTAGANTVMRQNSASGNGFFDSNGAVAAGSQTLNFSFGSSGKQTGCIASFAPPAAGPSTVKTIDGVAIASVKQVPPALAIASTKSVQGLT